MAVAAPSTVCSRLLRLLRAVCLLCALLGGTVLGSQPVQAADPLAEAGRLAVIDFMLQEAMRRELIGGAVVMVGNRSGVLYEHAVGAAVFTPGGSRLTTASVFDVASLTKVFATTPAIIKLMDEGKLKLLDPISRWFPEFDGCDVTVLHLLTHTSGLHDIPLDPGAPLASAIQRAAAQQHRIPAGSRFLYADINFILLGEMVRRISGQPLDSYVRQTFYGPLGMGQTGFTPLRLVDGAATLGRGKTAQIGIVQDENARLMGGVAGHAGLFSTGHDLARFAAMLLNDGVLNGHRVLSSRAVNQMVAPYYFRNGRVVRGLGWDRESAFSAPKGTLFSEFSYGHTGYSGTSVWIDPASDLYVVLLTTRLDYKNLRSFNKLRSDISTLAAALFSPRQRAGELPIP